MSWQAVAAVDLLPHGASRELEFRILLKLANVAAEDGTRAFRHVGVMASELGVSQRSVQRALKALEAAAIIRRGEQRVVAHLPENRRPTVYDVNLTLCSRWDEPSEPIPGVTQLSTDDLGVTSGVTTVVAHREEQIELLTKTSRGNQTPAVTPEACKGRRGAGPHLYAASGYCDYCGVRELVLA